MSAPAGVRLKAWVAERRRWLSSPAERARLRLVAADFKASAASFRRVAVGAPRGNPVKSAWMVSSFQTVWGAKMEAALSLALRTREYAPRPVYLSNDRFTRRYHELVDLGHPLFFPRRRAVDTRVAEDPAAVVLSAGRRLHDLLHLEYRGVRVGRIALSNYLNRHKFARFDIASPDTQASIGADLRSIAANVLAAEDLLAVERPSVVLLLEKGVSPVAELFGVCVREGVPVVQYAGAQKTDLYALKRYSAANATDHPFSLDAATWRGVIDMPWSRAHERSIMEELEQAYRGGTWFNRKYLHEGKSIKSAADVRAQLGLDPSKKTAVVFSHVLWDATFFYGTGLFDDYETWLLETVKAACANPRLNWVIKIHPDLVWKLKYEGFEGELRDVIALRSAVGSLPEHVKIVLPDTDISTYSFFEVTDYCLTVRGTIGIEMACHGVPVLTAGTGRYSGLGFTIDFATAGEYLQRLARLEETPPFGPREIELSRRYAYAVFHGRPWELRSFRTIKASVRSAGDPLDHNMVPIVRTFDELAAAQDMREFAGWIDSASVDFIKLETPASICAAS